MDSDGGGHRKRRSRDNGDQGLHRNDHEDEDVSEEDKMKAFFDLIQAARGARERLFGRKIAEGDHDMSQRRQPAVWIPTFQASDFMVDPGKDIDKVSAAASGGPSRPEENPGKGEGKEERDDGEGNDGEINLKLSL